MVSPPMFRIGPGPDGRLLGFKDLSGSSPLTIEIRDYTIPKLEAIWRPDDLPLLPPHPDLSDRSEEEWLDWVMALRRMNHETPSPQPPAPYNGLRSQDPNTKEKTMIASVHLKGGMLKARGFPMQWDTVDQKWEYALWTFKEPESTGDGKPSATHAMAGSVVLSIPGIPVASAVALKDGSGLELWLRAKRELDASHQDLVQASVTNLPEEDDLSGTQPEYLAHFKHFYCPVVDFGTNPPSKLRLPHPVGHTITRTSSFCPPTTHTEGS